MEEEKIKIGKEEYEVENIQPKKLEEFKTEAPKIANPYQDNQALTKKEAKPDVNKIVKEWNEKPEVKKIGVKAVKKSTLLLMWTAIVTFLLIFAIGVIWFNVSFADKEFTTNIPVNVDNQYNHTINAPTNVDNDHTIVIYNNNTLYFPEEMVEVLDELVEKLQNETS